MFVTPPLPSIAGPGQLRPPLVNIDSTPRPLNPFQTPPNPWGPDEAKWPETYINPTVKHGLDLVMPSSLRSTLSVEAGYDRFARLPTLTVDSFFPLKVWTDRSLFLAPRVSFASKTEGFSVGAGLRHLITAESLIGFYGFHDWTRSRGSADGFLREVGGGVEFSSLLGRYSDVSICLNAYFPVNERQTFPSEGNVLIRERLPVGWDARLGVLLPPFIDALDSRVSVEAHALTGERSRMTGYKLGLSLNTRDGMFTGKVEQGRDSRLGDHFKAEGSITLAFDWHEVINGNMPFSAPYKAPQTRFSRKVHRSLYDRIARRHDLPSDRIEKRIALDARVRHNEVYLSGGFPGLGVEAVTVQTASSPWQDRIEIVTDADGCYSGVLKLPPGEYKIRLIHKPTGRESEVRTIVVEN